MGTIEEISTITSKGQITLPKAIRQALSLSVGSRVVFSVRDGEVIVSKAGEAEHRDPAIEAFLGLIEKDIQAGRNIHDFPEDLAKAMLEGGVPAVDLKQDIEGDVAI